MPPKSVLERALELAGDGKHRTPTEVRDTLKAEGYQDIHGHTSGGTIVKQMKDRIAAAWRD